jgi:hypothetical protein
MNELDRLRQIQVTARGILHTFAWMKGKRGGRYWLPSGKPDVPANRLYGTKAEKAAKVGESSQANKSQDEPADSGNAQVAAEIAKAKYAVAKASYAAAARPGSGATAEQVQWLKARMDKAAGGASAVQPKVGGGAVGGLLSGGDAAELARRRAKFEKRQTPQSDSVDRDELDRVELIRPWGDKWQYRFQPGGKWYYASNESDAVKQAQEAYRRANPKELVTSQERGESADRARYAEYHARYGNLSLTQAKKLLDDARGVRGVTMDKEIAGTGRRRTGAAVTNQGARDAGEFKLMMNIYLRERVSKELAAGKPVPPEVLADYPDLASMAQGKARQST